MRINGLVMAVVSLLCAISVYATDKKKDLKGDLERVQGKWHLLSISIEDKIINSEDLPTEWKGTFGKALFVEGSQIGQVGYSNAKIELDDTCVPKKVTVKDVSGKLTFRGIYSLDGDTLKVCMNGDGSDQRRPEGFAINKGMPFIMIRLKKSPSNN